MHANGSPGSGEREGEQETGGSLGLGEILASRYKVLSLRAVQEAEVVDLQNQETGTLQLLATPPSPRQRSAWEFLRRVRHPSLVSVLGYGRDKERRYLSCGPCPETSLRSWCSTRAWHEVAPLVVQALQALTYLHGCHIVHGGVSLDVFWVRDDSSLVLASPTHSYRCEPSERRPMLDDFVGFYRCMNDIGALVELPAALRGFISQAGEDARQGRGASLRELREHLRISAQQRLATLPWRTLGRVEQLAQFDQVLDSICMGGEAPRTLWIHGDAGVGRSHLLRELRWRADERCQVVDAAVTSDFVSTLACSLPGLGGPLTAELAAQRFASNGPCIILLDDVQDMSEEAMEELLEFANAMDWQGQCALICTSTAQAPSELRCEQMALSAMAEQDLFEWLDVLPIGACLVKILCKESRGLPSRALALALACENMELSRASLSKDRKWLAELNCLSEQAKEILLAVATQNDSVEALSRAFAGGALRDLMHRGLLVPTKSKFRLGSGLGKDVLQRSFRGDELETDEDPGASLEDEEQTYLALRTMLDTDKMALLEGQRALRERNDDLLQREHTLRRQIREHEEMSKAHSLECEVLDTRAAAVEAVHEQNAEFNRARKASLDNKERELVTRGTLLAEGERALVQREDSHTEASFRQNEQREELGRFEEKLKKAQEAMGESWVTLCSERRDLQHRSQELASGELRLQEEEGLKLVALYSAMRRTGWNPTRAARILGITRAQVYAELRRIQVRFPMKSPYA